MAREIKFRLYSKVEKKYIDYLTIGFSKTGELRSYSTENGVGPVLDDNYIVEQYAGLKDKNGKEIYEGDIIQCHLSPISSTIFTGVVEFRPGCIMFKNFADSGAYAFNSLGAIEAVIGNIHENPELLGGKDE